MTHLFYKVKKHLSYKTGAHSFYQPRSSKTSYFTYKTETYMSILSHLFALTTVIFKNETASCLIVEK